MAQICELPCSLQETGVQTGVHMSQLTPLMIECARPCHMLHVVR